MKSISHPTESSSLEEGPGADLAVGAELDSNLASPPTFCVTLDKPFTSLGFSLLICL